jgi:hypothetical protein
MKYNACHFCQTSLIFEKTIRENKETIEEQILKQKENN